MHQWEFRSRFRRHAFGWRSQPAIQRIRQAVTEIKRAARRDPVLGAEGAVLLLERISPALENVDSSSGAIGTAVNKALDALVPLIAEVVADIELREGWLDRLWAAVVAAGADPKEAANVLANQFVATGVEPGAVNAGELAKLVAARSEIPRAAFDEALAKAGERGFSADPYLEQKVVADTAELDPIIARVIEANPGQAEQYRAGKHGLLGFFVGQVMKETGGKADARVVNARVRALLR